MVNTLYLPELREMLAENNTEELREFCTALHPARTADFMDGLTVDEAWQVLLNAEMPLRAEIFSFFDHERQIEIIETQDRDQIAELIAESSPDDRVDVLAEVKDSIVEDILPRVPIDERRDIMRLSAYPEETAGAVMTTEVARLSESLTVKQALDELARLAMEVETIYYLYIVDDSDHLRGIVSARQLIATLKKPDTKLTDLMETEITVANVSEDQEEVANKVARMDLLAIPVVDDERRLVGIITHDDVIDVMQEEAVEDAHQMGAVDPLDVGYMRTSFFTLSWKRGIWLTILFFAALLTAFALLQYDRQIEQWAWLVPFIPLVISTGGNSGNQSATLIITALTQGDVTISDWYRVVRREFLQGLVLGGFLAIIGYGFAAYMADPPKLYNALVIPITLLMVVVTGTMSGSILPIIFKRIGWNPALMSNPFVAGIVDILGILIYMNVAILLLQSPEGGPPT